MGDNRIEKLGQFLESYNNTKFSKEVDREIEDFEESIYNGEQVDKLGKNTEQIFDFLDSNGDGILVKEDLMALRESLGIPEDYEVDTVSLLDEYYKAVMSTRKVSSKQSDENIEAGIQSFMSAVFPNADKENGRKLSEQGFSNRMGTKYGARWNSQAAIDVATRIHGEGNPNIEALLREDGKARYLSELEEDEYIKPDEDNVPRLGDIVLIGVEGENGTEIKKAGVITKINDDGTYEVFEGNSNQGLVKDGTNGAALVNYTTSGSKNHILGFIPLTQEAEVDESKDDAVSPEEARKIIYERMVAENAVNPNDARGIAEDGTIPEETADSEINTDTNDINPDEAREIVADGSVLEEDTADDKGSVTPDRAREAIADGKLIEEDIPSKNITEETENNENTDSIAKTIEGFVSETLNSVREFNKKLNETIEAHNIQISNSKLERNLKYKYQEISKKEVQQDKVDKDKEETKYIRTEMPERNRQAMLNRALNIQKEVSEELSAEETDQNAITMSQILEADNFDFSTLGKDSVELTLEEYKQFLKNYEHESRVETLTTVGITLENGTVLICEPPTNDKIGTIRLKEQAENEEKAEDKEETKYIRTEMPERNRQAMLNRALNIQNEAKEEAETAKRKPIEENELKRIKDKVDAIVAETDEANIALSYDFNAEQIINTLSKTPVSITAKEESQEETAPEISEIQQSLIDRGFSEAEIELAQEFGEIQDLDGFHTYNYVRYDDGSFIDFHNRDDGTKYVDYGANLSKTNIIKLLKKLYPNTELQDIIDGSESAKYSISYSSRGYKIKNEEGMDIFLPFNQ